MGGMKDLRIDWENSGYRGRDVYEFAKLRDSGLLDGDRESYAALLGGEVDGDFVLCPSPGRPADDRSCCVRIGAARRLH